MVENANTIWADGPGGNPTEPQKSQIRAWGSWVEGVISGGFASTLVTTSAALKALDTDTYVKATLTIPNSRYGDWVWTLGDFSSLIAADTSEAVSMKADAVSATIGAWLRVMPKRELTPSMYGARYGGDAAANATAINAMIAFVRTTFDSGVYDFQYELDFEGVLWNVSAAINATLIRQPGLVFKNGGIASTASGAIALDLAGTNTPTFRSCHVHGDFTNQPAVGVLFARALSGGGFGGVTNAIIDGLSTTGSFTKAAVINFAAEEFTAHGLNLVNQSRSINSYCYIACNHAGTLDDYVGGVTSTFATIPVAADGARSNILHNLSNFSFHRDAFNPPAVTGITKANPAVVSHLPADLVASGITNGSKVFYHDIGGMTQLNGNVYTVANIDLVAGTFELSGVNSTAYSTFTSGGRSWNQTGPAMLMGGGDALIARASYLLAYGNDPLVIDTKNGGGPRMFDMEVQMEPQTVSAVKFGLPSAGTTVLQGFRLHLLAANQNFIDAVIREDAGAGALRIDDLDLKVYNMGVAPVNKVFKTPGKWAIHKGKITVPLVSALNTSPAAFTEYTVEETAFDRSPMTVKYGTWDFRNDSLSAAALRVVGYDDTSGHGPLQDNVRYSATPAASDGLGVYRFMGLNDALALTSYAQMRARALTVGAGSENGRLELMALVNGVNTLFAFASAGGLFVNAASFNPAAGTTTYAPMVMTAGVNMTSVSAGAWEYDGKAFYAACVANSRQIVTMKQIATVQGSTVALSNSSAAAQNVFAAANDVLTVAAATTYRFRAKIGLNTGATSHTTAFGLGGTATITSIGYDADTTSAASNTTPATPQRVSPQTAAATVLNAASTAVRTDIRIEGTIRVNGAGTIIPQITFSAGPTGTCETAVDSYFELEPIGSNTVASVGNWG